MNKRKISLFTSLLTAGIFASAEPKWNEDCEPGFCIIPQTSLLPEVIGSLLPPINDLDPESYRFDISTLMARGLLSARVLGWNADKVYSGEGAICAFDSTFNSDLPHSLARDDGDLCICSLQGDWHNPAQGCFTTTSQVVYKIHTDGRFGRIAALLYGNSQKFGGGNFDNEDKKKTAAAQEETEIKNFPGIYPRMSLTDLVIATGPILSYKEPLYKSKEGIFRTIAIPSHPMGSYTGITPSAYKAKHGQILRNHVILPTLIPVDVILTAAPDWRSNPTVINAPYISLFIEMLKTQMRALEACGSNTFVTGPIGCGVFANDPRVVALAYAYVLRYHRPTHLNNVVFCGDDNFYREVKRYYKLLSENFSMVVPSPEVLLNKFFPTDEDRKFLWPDFATKDKEMQKLFNAVSSAETNIIMGQEIDCLRKLIGDPDPNFARQHDAYGCGRMQGTTILHTFAWARKPSFVVALREWGFDINHLNASGRTPFDVYVERCGTVRHSNPDWPVIQYNLAVLYNNGAQCNVENNKTRLYIGGAKDIQGLLVYYEIMKPRQAAAIYGSTQVNTADQTSAFPRFHQQWQPALTTSTPANMQQLPFTDPIPPMPDSSYSLPNPALSSTTSVGIPQLKTSSYVPSVFSVSSNPFMGSSTSNSTNLSVSNVPPTVPVSNLFFAPSPDMVPANAVVWGCLYSIQPNSSSQPKGNAADDEDF